MAAGDFVNLWVGLVVCVPNWFLAGALVDMGMSWVQGMAAVVAGNAITCAVVVLAAHPGTKYGIPFPVLARASFGVRGAHVPALLRSGVACGWFGIQSWVGGQCLAELAGAAAGLAARVAPAVGAAAAALGPALATPVPGLGAAAGDLAAFAAFLAWQAAIVLDGMRGIKRLEAAAAPLLVALCLALLGWALASAGGLGPMLSAPSQFAPGGPLHGTFWPVFAAAVTANIGAWASLSLNISDFSRFAQSQRAQGEAQG